MTSYDFLIVGAGLYGATFARRATDAGKRCLVIDKRAEIAGNCFDERISGVLVNRYGGHIFHTNSTPIWDFVNRFSKFNHYEHRVTVRFNGDDYSFPINLKTFEQVWGLTEVEAIKQRIEEVKIRRPQANFVKDWVQSQVGPEFYEIFFEGYTTKQWGKSPADVQASIAKRIPIRFTDDDRYFDDKFQGLPIGGYTEMVARMLDGIEVQLEEEYDPAFHSVLGARVVYSGCLDYLFDYQFGPLEYRSLKFEHAAGVPESQGWATINRSDLHVPYTRTIEWNSFHPEEWHDKTVITTEWPSAEGEPYYPVTSVATNTNYKRYLKLVPDNMIVGGRLGSFKYLNMDQTIGMAMTHAKKALEGGWSQ